MNVIEYQWNEGRDQECFVSAAAATTTRFLTTTLRSYTGYYNDDDKADHEFTIMFEHKGQIRQQAFG